jgi:3-phenylpropionate/trans-cinnamate dioxygenase ferredoxin reductase component
MSRSHVSIDLVVLGSGPAAVAAAFGYRDAAGAGGVRVISIDPDIPYERPALSKEYLRGTVTEPDFAMHRPQTYADHDIELALGHTVVDLDPIRHELTTADQKVISYRRCVLATGAEPVRLPIPGANGPAVHTLHHLTDARRVRAAISGTDSAVVIGSGFIGCEAASSLARSGARVTLVSDELQPQSHRLGDWVASQIIEWLVADGIELRLGSGVAEISADARPEVLTTDHGDPIRAGLVLMAAGVRPRIELAKDAGLVISYGRIEVAADMRTSANDVFAVGDVAYAHNDTAGRRLAVEHWGDALQMGQIAGANAAGARRRWQSAPGFWSTIGDHTIKYSAWGDGFDEVRVAPFPDGAFTVWYGTDGRTVGVLTHERDEDYERGATLIEQAAPLPEI